MPIEVPRGLPFSVDTWSVSSRKKRHHFLTHAHKDHCSAISSFSSFPIYSTHLTKSLLLISFPHLDESLFVGIEIGHSIAIDDPDGPFSVTAFDANHCPGAVMFLFEGRFGNILHTGDCRLTLECLQKLPEKYLGNGERSPKCPLDYVFLDCTFGKSPLRIPSRTSAIREVINCIWRHPASSVVYLTCDLLGQEEVLINVFRTFGSKIYVDKVDHPEYYKALAIIAPEILSEDPSCRFQLYNGFPRLYERAQQKISKAKENMQPEPLIIRPSAQWYACEETELTAAEKRATEKTNEAVRDRFGIWHVCYSMHSSKQELERALQILTPKWVVSTTPSCQAMELGYVRKHCFKSQVASDDPLWKLLDIRVETSTFVNVEEEGSKSVEGKKTKDIGEAELQLLEVSSCLKVNVESSPLEKGPAVTLFGRARLGFDFCTLYEETKSSFSEESPRNLTIHEEDVEVRILDPVENKTDFYAPEVPNVEDMLKTWKPVDEIIKADVAVKLPESDKERRVHRPVAYSDNLRILYRSMNAPVPRPLPSLVELMKANKRARQRS